LRTYHRPRLGYNVVQNGPRPYPAHSFVWVQQGYTCRQWPFYRSQDDGKPCITFNKQRGFCKAGKCFGRSWNPFPAVPPPRIHPGGSGTIYTYVLVTPKYPRPMSNGGGRPPLSTSPEPPPAPRSWIQCSYLCSGWPIRRENEEDGSPCTTWFRGKGSCKAGRCVLNVESRSDVEPTPETRTTEAEPNPIEPDVNPATESEKGAPATEPELPPQPEEEPVGPPEEAVPNGSEALPDPRTEEVPPNESGPEPEFSPEPVAPSEPEAPGQESSEPEEQSGPSIPEAAPENEPEEDPCDGDECNAVS
ncbi:hypothetical protein HPB47_014753, partial [Ixodes persulcatus]